MSRLQYRLQSVPHEELLSFAGEAAATNLALRNKADSRIAQSAPTPERARTEVLLSADLAPIILGKLRLEDWAAAKVCKSWQGAWKLTRNQRPWLAHSSAIDLPGQAQIHSLASLPNGERLYIAAKGTDDVCRLLVLGPDYQVLQSVRTYAYRSGIELLATPLGLYDWSCDEDNIRRTQLDVDGTLEEEGSLIVEKSLTSCDLVEEIVELTSDPDGTLFASVQGVTHGVVALDPRTLEERFRFGGGYFRTIAGLCVVDKEVYVCDLVRLHGCSTFGSPCRFGRIQVFSLSGDYLREMRVDGMQDPRRLRFINGLLYLLDARPEGGSRIFVLTPDGVTLQTYDAPRLSPANLCLFAGGLLLTGTSGSELGPRHLERLGRL
jgi:hypothetical protein